MDSEVLRRSCGGHELNPWIGTDDVRAARIDGTVVAESLSLSAQKGDLQLGMPSGVLTVGADVAFEKGQWVAHAGSFCRTARRLFDGRMWVPGRQTVR
jgi:2-methylaconitate cis-trans-isomerase PrpF